MVFLGMIERIDQVIRKDKKKMFFVHFLANSWGKTDEAKFALQQLCDGELRVFYDEPYFWKLSISKSKRSRREERRRVPDDDINDIRDEVRNEINSRTNTSGQAVEMNDTCLKNKN